MDFVFNVKKYLSLSGSYSYIDAENEEGLILIRIPKNKANINFDFIMNESTKFSISVYYNGKETDPRADVAKCVRTDLNFLKKLNLNKELYIKVKNIFDEKYQDIYCENIYIKYQKKYYQKLKFSEILLRICVFGNFFSNIMYPDLTNGLFGNLT